MLEYTRYPHRTDRSVNRAVVLAAGRYAPNDQWNGIHEALVRAWEKQRGGLDGARLHVAHIEVEESGEDWMTAAYMLDVANQAGWEPPGINMSDIGWDARTKPFRGP
jgi:glutathionylspermidine synthase